jgi:hypothetical protein
MGLELMASLGGSKSVPIEALAEELCSTGLCVIESVTPDLAKFRWASSPRREHWPEDVTLGPYQGDLLLTLHSWSGQQAEQFVKAVEVAVSELLSEAVTFEEL